MTSLDDVTRTEPLYLSVTDEREPARPGSRIQRARMPLAKDVVEAVAVSHGVCIRPVLMRVTDELTGRIRDVDVPCGATLAAKCPSCAERARRLRVHQCREGWHLEAEPDLTPDVPNDEQRDLATARADMTAARDEFTAAGDDLSSLAATEALQMTDAELRKAGIRGDIDPPLKPRRIRSTRRREDTPDLPKRDMVNTTLGRAFTGRDGQVFRPSMFLTVTLPSYGRVRSDGTPADPGTYDYRRAARDAIAFSRLIDRLIQNLRRVAGYDVQYFAAVEPQRRLAAHAHFAIRGTIPRALIKQVVAATYHQVWWPETGAPVYDDLHRPLWQADRDNREDRYAGTFVDPVSGSPLIAWDDALDAIDVATELDCDVEPYHVARLGSQVDVQGLLSGTPEADRRVRYLAKYLTKSMTEAHEPEDGPQSAHLDRLVAALAVEPCSPTCPNWLRYGITPKNAHHGMRPGSCRSKAHRREHLGYAGRRILVSRKWSGKTLADHKHDRRAWVMATLGVQDQSAGRSDTATPADDMTRERYSWRMAERDEALKPLTHRLLIAVANRQKWRAALDAAKNGQPPPTDEELSATGNGREGTAK
ncbi:hypothetical protein GCM10022223_47180 [Kineosporia mesophila]|uniref:Replication initiator protein n=1 Tax=Kineosporia mesophila TaxID=566012 RepID=A0ABP7A495_9ACTN|nr:replication initiator [Kineosporia mesophila]MCD5353825.1 hypothetical protein [Kineosporia mesophila]